jgi:AbrB family looped-hinge helix DNA binding protein
MKVVKCTSKGQVTIPVEVREALGITAESCLEVAVSGDEVRMRKLVAVRPLGGDDPIWGMVGAGASGASDISENHDRYLADSERKRWGGSS